MKYEKKKNCDDLLFKDQPLHKLIQNLSYTISYSLTHSLTILYHTHAKSIFTRTCTSDTHMLIKVKTIFFLLKLQKQKKKKQIIVMDWV